MTNISVSDVYFSGAVTAISKGNSVEVVISRDILDIKPRSGDIIYKIRSNDRLDRIAQEHYGQVTSDAYRYWYLIADANGIATPFDLSDYVGKDIFIPNLFDAKAQMNNIRQSTRVEPKFGTLINEIVKGI